MTGRVDRTRLQVAEGRLKTELPIAPTDTARTLKKFIFSPQTVSGEELLHKFLKR
ncbi:hypothetical protein CCP3SC15_120005 [Gammaproteobacteria bacterium]